jgi:hypothetical protein
VHQTHRWIRCCLPHCFGFERGAEPGLHPATVVLGRNRKRIGCPGLRLQFVPAVRGQCGHLRGNPAIEPLPTVPGSTIFMLAWPVYRGLPHG